MAENDLNANAPSSPPHLAEKLVGLLADPMHREVLLGDMGEEFEAMWDRSPEMAQKWYWRQCLASILPLTVMRTRLYIRRAGFRMGLAMVVTVLVMFFWEQSIARSGAWWLANLLMPDHLTFARICYGMVKLTGFLFIGAGLWLLLSHRDEKKLFRLAQHAWPVIVLMLLPPLGEGWSSVGTELFPLRGMIMLLALPCWLFGLWICKHLFSKRSAQH